MIFMRLMVMGGGRYKFVPKQTDASVHICTNRKSLSCTKLKLCLFAKFIITYTEYECMSFYE